MKKRHKKMKKNNFKEQAASRIVTLNLENFSLQVLFVVVVSRLNNNFLCFLWILCGFGVFNKLCGQK